VSAASFDVDRMHGGVLDSAWPEFEVGLGVRCLRRSNGIVIKVTSSSRLVLFLVAAVLDPVAQAKRGERRRVGAVPAAT